MSCVQMICSLRQRGWLRDIIFSTLDHKFLHFGPQISPLLDACAYSPTISSTLESFGPQISPLLDACAYSPFGLRTGHGTIPKRSGSLPLRLQLCSAHELED
jgi:hypothetical protein